MNLPCAWLVPCCTRGAPYARILATGTTLGRNATCAIRLDYDVISGEHFRILFNGDWALTDMSINGTVVNKTFVGQGLTKILQEGDVVSIPIRRDECLRLRFTLKGRQSSARDVEDMRRTRLEGQHVAAMKRVLESRRTKEDLEMQIGEMRACKRRREADLEPQPQPACVWLAEQAELQEELKKNLQLRSRFVARRDIIDKASGDDLAKLEGLFDELLACNKRCALMQGGVEAQRQFLRDIAAQHHALQIVLRLEKSATAVLRGELRASWKEIDAEKRSSTERRAILAAISATIDGHVPG